MNIEIEVNIKTDNPKWNDLFNHIKDLPFNKEQDIPFIRPYGYMRGIIERRNCHIL